jgi:hypothetical protein
MAEIRRPKLREIEPVKVGVHLPVSTGSSGFTAKAGFVRYIVLFFTLLLT